VANFDRDVDRIEKTVQDQLTLKRAHVSIRDAHLSLILGVAVTGFTVITIIFTPLTFIVSLFALALDTLLQNQFQFGGTGGIDEGARSEPSPAFKSSYVGKWFGEYNASVVGRKPL